MSAEYKPFFPDREDMDLNTPHGNAQARIDELFEVSQTIKGPVTYTAPGEIDAETYFRERDQIKIETDPKRFNAPKKLP